jgi:hypothetical protein
MIGAATPLVKRFTVVSIYERSQMYTGRDFKSREDLASCVEGGMKVTVFQSRKTKFFTHEKCPQNGIVSIQGPHITATPEDYKSGREKDKVCHHSWFTQVRLENGIIKEVF